ncbi:CATRA system-associated protein [Lentzea waywayandensis]|uniref:CATRA system-associated protein n=1 Tax=Lentzea waywayandensis TaxID=84724 RepID=UPI0011603C1B|nr:CATRA system-associated protein [Lentzea waywayandensis]
MTIDPELVRDVAEKIQWFVDGRRTPNVWQRFDSALTAVGAAHGANDAAAMEQVLYELELLSRRVAEKQGQESAEEPPPKVRDRANELVHTLLPDDEQDE